MWSEVRKNVEVELLSNNAIAKCNKGSGMGMSGVLGKEKLDPNKQSKHSLTFEILKVSSYFAIGVAGSSAILDSYDDDGEHIVLRSSGEIRAFGRSIAYNGQTALQEGDTVRIDVDFDSKKVTFSLNGTETIRVQLQTQQVLYPYFSACLGASVELLPTEVSRHLPNPEYSIPTCKDIICGPSNASQERHNTAPDTRPPSRAQPAARAPSTSLWPSSASPNPTSPPPPPQPCFRNAFLFPRSFKLCSAKHRRSADPAKSILLKRFDG